MDFCSIMVCFLSAIIQSENNGESFFCQHGPAECTANRMQSCALDALNEDQDAKVKFVTCQMDWNAEYTGQKVEIFRLIITVDVNEIRFILFSNQFQCANQSNISYVDVQKCLNGSEGIELQLQAEKETHLIRKPYPRFIPTIVYDKVSETNLIRNQFTVTRCKLSSFIQYDLFHDCCCHFY